MTSWMECENYVKQLFVFLSFVLFHTHLLVSALLSFYLVL